jgi:excisionase family DNA binding protein
MSPEETAEALGVSLSSIYRGVRDGRIPHRRLGRRIILNPAAVEAWARGEDG